MNLSTLCLIPALVLKAAVGEVMNLPETGVVEFLLNRRSELSQSEGRDGETWRVMGVTLFRSKASDNAKCPVMRLHEGVSDGERNLLQVGR